MVRARQRFFTGDKRFESTGATITCQLYTLQSSVFQGRQPRVKGGDVDKGWSRGKIFDHRSKERRNQTREKNSSSRNPAGDGGDPRIGGFLRIALRSSPERGGKWRRG